MIILGAELVDKFFAPSPDSSILPRSQISVLVAVPAPSPAPATGAGPNSGISVRIFDFWDEFFENNSKTNLNSFGPERCPEVLRSHFQGVLSTFRDQCFHENDPTSTSPLPGFCAILAA